MLGVGLLFYGYTKTDSEPLPAIQTRTLKDQMDSIGSTGWVFLGYFDSKINEFSEGPFYYLFKSAYRTISDTPNIHKGDIIAILERERKVVIVNFKKTGLVNYQSPPLADLTNDDYTDVTIPIGTKLIIEDLSISSYPNSPYAVWARIRLE
jgi:hypothetical protein